MTQWQLQGFLATWGQRRAGRQRLDGGRTPSSPRQLRSDRHRQFVSERDFERIATFER